MSSAEAKIRVLTSLSDIARKDWDRLANPGWRLGHGGRLEADLAPALESDSEREGSTGKESGNKELAQPPESDCGAPDKAPQTSEELPFNPFISHDFLWSLEESGCALPETGWASCHLALERADDSFAGVVPAYLKSHSQGEYVFDHGWADAFYRAGGEYYPKLQISVPFTPATGRRLLVGNEPDSDAARKILASGIRQAASQFEASSAHLTFLTEDEAKFLEEDGYLHRTDQQFHWVNECYGSFDDFLGALASRKRKTIRRERRDAQGEDIAIDWVTGTDITEHHWDVFFRFYMDTGARKWGTPYLNREAFSLIGERMAERILLIFARRGTEIIAGALNFIGSDTLYGRYWGTTEDLPFLHFEVCYYQAIEFAIQNRLRLVEAGAQGAHKLARGYLPVTTHSAHHIVHPGLRNAVAAYLDQEREAVAEESELLKQMAPFKRDRDAG